MKPSPRHDCVESALKEILRSSSGIDWSKLDRRATFFQLGFDSLFLIQFSQRINKQLGVKVSFRQMIEELPSIEALVDYVAEHIAENRLQPPQSVAVPTAATQAAPPLSRQPTNAIERADESMGNMPLSSDPIPDTDLAIDAASASGADNRELIGSADGLEQIITQQNQLMALQLKLLAGMAATNPAAANNIPTKPHPEAQPESATRFGSCQCHDATSASIPAVKDSSTAAFGSEHRRFGPYKPVRKTPSGGLTDQQRRHLDELTARLTAKTQKSREHAQRHRPHFADPRGVAAYRRLWKSMVYQISVERSRGSRLWDIDGNEYIDIAMGFGLNLFGQSPPFITEALQSQLTKGVEVGPQSPLAGEVAQLLCDLTRKDRATFCNTGSEAVMGALRIARTVTDKSKIVFFNKDYHGNFDEVLLRCNQVAGQWRTSPAAPGVPFSLLEDVIVLPYGEPESLEFIRERADELAAVLVEPVQSANPFLQPREFLQEVRQITAEKDIAMIMDEVITGFRAAQGGAQEYFDVWADMATYGKILGGGLPIGAIAGSSRFMDALDGGMWRYEDDSEPLADMTFFAGTFVRHPLAMAAAHQVLMKLKEQGPELQQDLTAKTKKLADRLNQFFESESYPIRVAQFASQFRMMFPTDLEYADLLYFHLLDRGIFMRGWEDNCFLSTAHTDEDVERIIQAVKESCVEIRNGGFLPDAGESEEQVTAATKDGVSKKKLVRFPLTEAQLEIWVTSRMGDQASCAYNEPFTVRFRGHLNADLLCEAIQTVVARHGSLHVRFDKEGRFQETYPAQSVDIEQEDLSGLSEKEQAAACTRNAEYFASRPFDFSTGPLIRLKLIKLADEEHVLFFSAHHIVSDGWSTNLMLAEIGEAYTALTEQRIPDLPEPGHFDDYVAMESAEDNQALEAVAYWRNEFRELPDPLDLPYDRPRPAIKSYAGRTFIHKFQPETHQAIKKVAAQNHVTLFSITFAALNVLLARLSGQDDIVVTIPTAGQILAENQCLVGHCVNLLPIRSRLNLQDSFESFLGSTQTRVLSAFDHQRCTLGRIVRELRIRRDPSRIPLVEVNFNIDRDGMGLKLPDLELEIAQSVKTATVFDLFFNLNETDHGLELYLDYSQALFDEETIRRWVNHYETLLQAIAEDPATEIGCLPLLTDREQEQILVDWNETASEYPSSRTVHQLFEQQVQSSPHAVAVVVGEASYSYRNINERANQLAQTSSEDSRWS